MSEANRDKQGPGAGGTGSAEPGSIGEFPSPRSTSTMRAANSGSGPALPARPTSVLSEELSLAERAARFKNGAPFLVPRAADSTGAQAAAAVEARPRPAAGHGSSLRTALAALSLVVLVGGLVGMLLGRWGDRPAAPLNETRASDPAQARDTRPDGTRRGPLAYDLTRRPTDEIVGAWRPGARPPPRPDLETSARTLSAEPSPLVDRTDLDNYPDAAARDHAASPSVSPVETSSVQRKEAPAGETSPAPSDPARAAGYQKRTVAPARTELPGMARHEPSLPHHSSALEEDAEPARPTSERVTVLPPGQRTIEENSEPIRPPAERVTILPPPDHTGGRALPSVGGKPRPAPDETTQAGRSLDPAPPGFDRPAVPRPRQAVASHRTFAVPLPERNPRARAQPAPSSAAVQRAVRRAKLVRISKAKWRSMPVDPLAEHIRDAVEHGVVFTRTGRTSP